MTAKKYDIVYIDPPWMYYGSPDKMAAAGKHYALIPDAEMLALDVRSYMEPKRSIAFVWATGPRKGFAYKCIESWGLYDRGEAFHWIKTRADGTPIGAQGVRASITKPLVETVLAASPMPRGRPLPIADESVPQTVFYDPPECEKCEGTGWVLKSYPPYTIECHGALRCDCQSTAPATEESQTIYAPRGAHSEKPEEIYRRIERMYPNASKLEIFARKRRPGWDAIGNELDPPSFVRSRILPSPNPARAGCAA